MECSLKVILFKNISHSPLNLMRPFSINIMRTYLTPAVRLSVGLMVWNIFFGGRSYHSMLLVKSLYLSKIVCWMSDVWSAPSHTTTSSSSDKLQAEICSCCGVVVVTAGRRRRRLRPGVQVTTAVSCFSHWMAGGATCHVSCHCLMMAEGRWKAVMAVSSHNQFYWTAWFLWQARVWQL